jgi:hypothetical protein
MNTSYFAKPGIADDPRSVSIARFPPRWWGSRRRYIALSPSIDLFHRSKNGLSTEAFEVEFRKSLSLLDPAKVYADIGADSILLCFEKLGDSCHRRIVAAWLEQSLDISVPEL